MCLQHSGIQNRLAHVLSLKLAYLLAFKLIWIKECLTSNNAFTGYHFIDYQKQLMWINQTYYQHRWDSITWKHSHDIREYMFGGRFIHQKSLGDEWSHNDNNTCSSLYSTSITRFSKPRLPFNLCHVFSMAQCVAHLTRYQLSPVSREFEPINGSPCFLEQEIGWFRERIWAWFT